MPGGRPSLTRQLQRVPVGPRLAACSAPIAHMPSQPILAPATSWAPPPRTTRLPRRQHPALPRCTEEPRGQQPHRPRVVGGRGCVTELKEHVAAERELRRGGQGAAEEDVARVAGESPHLRLRREERGSRSCSGAVVADRLCALHGRRRDEGRRAIIAAGVCEVRVDLGPGTAPARACDAVPQVVMGRVPPAGRVSNRRWLLLRGCVDVFAKGRQVEQQGGVERGCGARAGWRTWLGCTDRMRAEEVTLQSSRDI